MYFLLDFLFLWYNKHIMDLTTKANILKIILIVFFIYFFAWWLILQYFTGNATSILFWSNLYQLIALIGGISGIIVSKNLFYGMRSCILIEKSILFMSIGLLFQVFGQIVFGSYFFIYGVDIPYPSLADVGFFGSSLFYIRGLLYLAGITGIRLKLISFWHKKEVLLIPIVLLLVSYFIFLDKYNFDWNYPMRIFLDFGYPFIEITYVTIALIILLYGKNLVGGIMNWPPLLLAMFMQYSADFNFIYQVKNGTWVNGGYGDLLYLIAYFILAYSLIGLGLTFKNLIENNKAYGDKIIAED